MGNGTNQYDPNVYGASFFAEWGGDNAEYRRSARAMAEVIFEQYQPSTVLDLGCGAAMHAGRLAELGVQVTCADAFECPADRRAPNIERVISVDLMEPLEPAFLPRADLVLCLDVAEHLPDSHHDVLVRNCTTFSDTVVFSAAPPGQGGIGHINEQPRGYWIDAFHNAGYRYCRREAGWLDRRALARREELTLRWMATQAAVYRRGLKFPYPPRVPKALPIAKENG